MSSIDEVIRTLKVMRTSVQIMGQNPALTEVTSPLYIYFNEFWTRSIQYIILCVMKTSNKLGFSCGQLIRGTEYTDMDADCKANSLGTVAEYLCCL